MCCFIVDFRASFDNTNKWALFYNFGRMGVSMFLSILRGMYEGTMDTISILTKSGVRCSCISGLLLFTLFLIDLDKFVGTDVKVLFECLFKLTFACGECKWIAANNLEVRKILWIMIFGSLPDQVGREDSGYELMKSAFNGKRAYVASKKSIGIWVWVLWQVLWRYLLLKFIIRPLKFISSNCNMIKKRNYLLF